MRKELATGLLLTTTFFITFGLMLSPLFDDMNFIQYADCKFNQYSKHSSYFIPTVLKNSEKYVGRTVSSVITFENNDLAEKAAKLYLQIVNTQLNGNTLRIEGDLGAIVARALEDSEKAYWNEEEYFRNKYGMSAKEVLYLWHVSLESIAKSLEKEGRIDESLFLKSQVITRVIEPSYNFYGIEPEQMDVVGGFLLVFYVIYTLWWGFAIYYLLEGCGIKITRAKAKREV